MERVTLCFCVELWLMLKILWGKKVGKLLGFSITSYTE